MHKYCSHTIFLVKKYMAEAASSGAAWVLVAKVAAMGSGLLFNVLISRWYGSEAVGIIALISTLLILISSTGLMGINTAILRFIPMHVAMYSHDSARAVCRKSALIITASSGLLCCVAALTSEVTATLFFSKPYLAFYFLIAAPFIIFQALLFFQTETIRALQSIKRYSLILILPQSINICLLLSLYRLIPQKNLPLYTYLTGIGISAISGIFLTRYLFTQRCGNSENIKRVTAGTIVKTSIPMLTTTLVQFIIGYTGVITTGVFCSVEEVAYFAVAVKFSLLATLVLQAVNSVAAPKFSELFHKNDLAGLTRYAKGSARLAFYGSLPVLVFLFCSGSFLLTRFFGEEFDAAHTALMILLCGQLIECSTGLPGMFLNMTRRQVPLSKIMLLTAVLNIVLSVFLVRRFGVEGAAVASVISLCFWKSGTIIYIKKQFGFYFFYTPLSK